MMFSLKPIRECAVLISHLTDSVYFVNSIKVIPARLLHSTLLSTL